jgi:hypothetical protein
MAYRSTNIAIAAALTLLRARGVSHPEDEIVQALQDGQLPSWGLVAMEPPIGRRPVPAAWSQLNAAWWHHLTSPLDDSGIVYFAQRPTQPPTPFRAAGIEVPRKRLDELWPEHAEQAAAFGLSPQEYLLMLKSWGDLRGMPRDIAFAGSENLTTVPLSRDTETSAVRGAKSRAILEAINQCWPQGIPTGLSAKDRDNAILGQLRENKSSIPENLPRAVQRALKLLRPK